MRPTTRDEREGQARDLLRALRNRSPTQKYGWNGDVSVQAGLLSEGSRFEFVQAMRLLTRIAQRVPRSATAGAEISQTVSNRAVHAPALPMVKNAPEAVLMGEEHDASGRLPAMDKAAPIFSVRLRARVGMDFSPASVHAILPSGETEGAIEVVANLFALGGQNAPLPEPYAEKAMDRQRLHDMAMTDFLDIFHHRLLELYYHTTLHAAPWLEWKHPAANSLAQMIYSVAGLGPLDLRDRMTVPDRIWLKYAGLLWHTPRPASGFDAILSDHFKLPVRSVRAAGRWLPIEREDWSRLGQETCRLGESATLGTRVWMRKAGLLIHIGPVPDDRFDSFLPTGEAYGQVMEMAKFYFNGTVTLDLELEAAKLDQRSARLGATRLSWTSRTQPGDDAQPVRVYLPYGRAPKTNASVVSRKPERAGAGVP